MAKTITIDPVTRISGFLEINTVIENHIIVNAKTSGRLFRGFEKMLKGRVPTDATYFTERICGICSTSHAIASALALESTVNCSISRQDLYLRDLMHGFEFLQNHLRQFYFFTLPDYVMLLDVNPIAPQVYKDYRLNESETKKITESYKANFEYSRLAHEGLAVLGGKAPHTHGIFAGGVTVNLDAYKLQKILSIIKDIKRFVNDFMLRDIDIIASRYSDYFHKGTGVKNYLSYGLFDEYEDSQIKYVDSGVMIDGKRAAFEPNKITEQIYHSWYRSNQEMNKPGEMRAEEVDLTKSEGYSFIKAPRYDVYPMEGGPLARLMLSGEYTRGSSCMDRNVARVLETKKIIQIMENIANRLELYQNTPAMYPIPEQAHGTGLTDTIRGALGHWVEIENKVIKHYDIITPTGWNLSPMDAAGIHGPAEKSLIGTPIHDDKQPVEIGRIVRSFDPCVSCATH